MNDRYYEDRGDLEISGAGSSGGGKFNKVQVSGASKINGDIDCVEFEAAGAAKFEGNVKTVTYNVSGATKCTGNVEAEACSISGAGKIGGNLNSKRSNIQGSLKVCGNLTGETIDIQGATSIVGDCEAEDFKCSGAFKIGGLLNSENILVEISGKCEVSEMGGRSIKVRLGNWSVGILSKITKAIFNYSLDELDCNVIEGDDIYLESTTARIVRGTDVVIGKKCTIQRVEYHNTISIDPSSKVIEQVQL
ncbi:cell shape determination protein CcmA [Clostridium sp. YIM B02505]|uniref:Cell shape determination protein CcmA n=1 Tax=Clostridium yunnanense TaxID=2800325 RepID=A0ABS1ESW8_9CLOT|nr:cell shape determination protein CcmA [Clostridium yunnanense]MBK1812481.1 cell shape determination protein CcmA [Clostridium yunnanense]